MSKPSMDVDPEQLKLLLKRSML